LIITLLVAKSPTSRDEVKCHKHWASI